MRLRRSTPSCKVREGALSAIEVEHDALAFAVATDQPAAEQNLADWKKRRDAAIELGHGLIMPEPETDGGEFDHCEEVRGVFFVTGCDATAMLDLVEEPLDAIAVAIEHTAEAGAPPAVDLGWNIRCGARGLHATPQPIGIVGLVGEQDRSLAQMAQQPDSGGQSDAWPGVRTNSSGRPLASVSAWIFVVSPPRLRPIQRSPPLFLSWRHVDAREPKSCRSSAHCHRGRR